MSDFFTSNFFGSSGYNPQASTSAQGQLSSAYTSALTDALTDATSADYAAWLFFNAGNSQADALAVKEAIAAGQFSLTGLFGAAQSKTGAVDGGLIENPDPMIRVNFGTAEAPRYAEFSIKAMLGDLDTETWTTQSVGKKGMETIYHTREFYTDTAQPQGYDATWSNPDPVEPEIFQGQTDAVTVSKLPGSASQFLSFELAGAHQDNIVLHYTGFGDYNGNMEGFTISNEAIAQFRGLENKQGTETFFQIGNFTALVTDLDDDGNVEITIDFTSQTQNGSSVTAYVTYDYWF